MGKGTQYWNLTRNKLKKEFKEKGLVNCEVKLDGCWHNNGLSFAHRHKRREYYSCPKMLGNHNQVILACINCHQKLEHDKSLTRETFERLRGKDEMPTV